MGGGVFGEAVALPHLTRALMANATSSAGTLPDPMKIARLAMSPARRDAG